jgi:hypothetical protein
LGALSSPPGDALGGRVERYQVIVCITAANTARLSAAHAAKAQKSVFMARALWKAEKAEECRTRSAFLLTARS